MHFPIVYEYKPDIQGINLENEIRNEPRKLNPQSKKIEIIIPKYAPFFTKSLELTKRDGSPLKPGDDYRIHRIMGGLTERAGQGVGSTIEILNKSLSEVLISYKTLGHFALIDNSVLQTIIDVAEDDRIIHWDDLHGKPVVFPPKWHSHGLNDEITGLSDVLELIEDISKTVDAGLNDRTETDKVKNYLELLKHYIKVNTDMVRELVVRHEGTKNSHGLTKQQIGLSNVENNPTGDLSNINNKDDGYKIKPGDFAAYLDTKIQKPENFLKDGVIPINQYGSDEYIPPPISGSFEAAGTEGEIGAFEETANDIIILKNRYDGRVNGLYFSVLKNYNSKPILNFTSFRYNHPFLESRIGFPTSIGQSSKESILVGGNGRVFLGLTSGTLNPGKHKYSELDFSDHYELASKGHFTNLDYLNSVCMGRWVYVFVNLSTIKTPAGTVGCGSRSVKVVFKVLRKDVGVENVLKPKLVNLTYTDLNERRHVNSNHWVLGDYVQNTGGMFTKCVYDFSSSPVTYNFLFYRGAPILVDNESEDTTVVNVRFMFFFYGVHYLDDTVTRIGVEVLYKWNTETDVMEKIFHYPKDIKLREVNNPAVVGITDHDWFPTTVGLNSGIYTLRMAIDAPTNVKRGFYRPGKNRQSLFTPIPLEECIGSSRNHTEEPDYPVESSPYISAPILDEDGYYFYARSTKSGKMELFYKKSPGGYAIRPEIKLDRHTKLYSKKLSSNVYKVVNDLGVSEWHRFNVTTTFKDLASKKLTTGFGAICYGFSNRYTTTLGDSSDPNGVIVPGMFNPTFNEGNKTVKWDIPVRIVYKGSLLENFFKSQGVVLPNDGSYTVGVFDPSEDKNIQRHFKETPIVISLYVFREERRRYDIHHYVVRVRGVVSSGVKNITSIELIDKREMTPGFSGAPYFSVSSYNIGSRMPYETAPGFFLDYDKREVVCVLDGLYRYPVSGGAAYGYTVARVDMDTGKIKEYVKNTPGTLGGRSGTGLGIAPGLGLCYRDMLSSSVASAWRSFSTDESILMSSGYLETGWVVYFGASLEVILGGKSYRVEPGSIDLRDISPAPENKTFYIYVLLRGGKIEYEITEVKKMESNSLIWIGTVETSTTKIEKIERSNAFTIDGVSVSQRKRGNAIPATSGSINEEGQLPWLTKAELGLLF